MRQRRLAVLTALTAALVLGAAALVLAQATVPITITADAKVIPNKAGTPRHPQGVVLDVRAHITMPDDYDPPLVQSIDIWFPKGGLYNGAKFPSCSQNTLARKGLRACKKASIMGHGTGDALADTVVTHPTITVVNGGANKVYFYTVLVNPARVQAPVPATITKLSSPKWSYRTHATIPHSLQIVAGIPIVLRDLHIRAGRGDWLATTSCPPSHKWPYHVEVTFDNGAVTTYDSSVACR